MGVKVNDNIGKFFKTFKGLRQGDSLSPLLFDLAIDALAIIMDRARNEGFIKGVLTYNHENGVNMLQYADDTILFIDKDEEKAGNLKKVLTCFEQVSGMRINYTKSELIPIGLTDEEIVSFSNIMGCTVGAFPIKYLGIPLHYDKLRREDI